MSTYRHSISVQSCQPLRGAPAARWPRASPTLHSVVHPDEALGSPGSGAYSCRTCQGLRFHGGGPLLSLMAKARMAFPVTQPGRRTQSRDSGDQWLPCAYPYRGFIRDVTPAGPRPWAMAACYAFHVGLFHPLLYAGLPAAFCQVRCRPRAYYSRLKLLYGRLTSARGA